MKTEFIQPHTIMKTSTTITITQREILEDSRIFIEQSPVAYRNFHEEDKSHNNNIATSKTQHLEKELYNRGVLQLHAI